MRKEGEPKIKKEELNKEEKSAKEKETEIIEKSEFIPTPEDIQFVFEELLKVEKYETVRQLEDEKGLYLWDIKVSEEDGYTEYSYMRKGRYPEGQASDTAVHVVFFDKEDFPVSGHSVIKHIEGEWKLTS